MKIERKWGCEAPILIYWSEIDIDRRVRDSKKDAPELRRRVWSARYRAKGAMIVQTTAFWRVAWSLFLCPLHCPFSSLLEGKVVFAVEQPPVDEDRSATALPAWGLDKDDEREKVQRKCEEIYDVSPPLRKKIARWLLTWRSVVADREN